MASLACRLLLLKSGLLSEVPVIQHHPTSLSCSPKLEGQGLLGHEKVFRWETGLGHKDLPQVWLLLAPSALLRIHHRSLSNESLSKGQGQGSTGPWQAFIGKRSSWPMFAWIILAHHHAQCT